ncbi:spry domain containing socs box protein [Anaeramoeba flamelloides]|uniref:Spry domain containing socs box protein n=1 Tax=Anaeramoeba flamelloides TaxID=1746091 RepID=A0AAV7ZPR8_9EUKA|nr:spry domain containing socs box protein [Anaeramoeba flamelloides]
MTSNEEINEADREIDFFDSSTKSETIVLSNNNQTASNHSSSRYTVCGKKIYSQGLHTIKVKMHNGGIIGVIDVNSRSTNQLFYDHQQAYMYQGSKGSGYGTSLKWNGGKREIYGEKYCQGDIITIHLDMNKKNISFSNKNNNFGIAYSNLPESVCFGAVLYGNSSMKITIL